MKDDVTFQRTEYAARVETWAKVDAATNGEEAVKEGKDKYLPKPNPHDPSQEASERYLQYITRACYFNAAGRTLMGLTGLAFSKWPEVELAGGLEFLLDDADGSGVGLINQAQSAVAQTLKHGRCGVLVDFPSVQAPSSLAEQQAGYARPTITLYAAPSVINWRTDKVGAKSVLSLVVIREFHPQPGVFELAEVEKYRELRLEEGRYIVRIWHKPKDVWLVESESEPTDGAGRPWSVIPFQFVGAVNNDESPDESPMLDLCNVNLAHYRNSADYEESVFFSGQPQFYVTGIDQGWWDLMKKDGVYVGSRAVMAGPVGSAFGLLQAAPNSLAKEAMDAKEKMMAALGARLVEPGSAAKTASQSNSEERVAHSVLSLVCDNVSAAYSKALEWCGQFMGVTQKPEAFEIDTDFGALTVDAQQLTAVVAAWQGGKLPDSDGYAYLRKVGLMDAGKTDEEAAEEIAQSGGGLALDEDGTVPAAV